MVPFLVPLGQHMAGDASRLNAATVDFNAYLQIRNSVCHYHYVIKDLAHDLLGEMEKTMLFQFTRSQNLRALLQPHNIPPAIHGLLQAYQKIFNSDVRGTLLHDTLSYDETYTRMEEDVTWSQKEETRLSTQVYELLFNWMRRQDVRGSHSSQEHCSARAFIRSHIKWLGQTFSVQSGDKLMSNSLVIFPDEKGNEKWSAGGIRKIFSHTHQDVLGSKKTLTFFLIEEYSGLREDHIQFDNYRKFPALGGRIFYNTFNAQLILLPTEEILGHFGYTARKFQGIEDDCIHVYPFTKVCLYL